MSHQVLGARCAPTDSSSLRGRGIGVMFFAFFGTCWMAGGLNSVYGLSGWSFSAVVLVGIGLFVSGWRQTRREANDETTIQEPDAPERAHIAKVFRNVNIAQWAAAIALVVTLNVVQHVEWIVPGIMLIVGLHFFPLAKLFRHKLHYATGAALTALAASYPFLTAAGPSSGIGPIGAGLILWCSAAAVAVAAARR